MSTDFSTATVGSVMTQFLAGDSTPVAPTGTLPDSVMPEPTQETTPITAEPVEASVEATPAPAEAATTPEPEVEEPPANGPIPEIRAWGKREKQGRIAAEQQLSEAKVKLDEIAPLVAKVDEAGGPEAVEYAMASIQKMRDPRFASTDPVERGTATAEFLQHFEATDPENYAAFDRQLQAGYRHRIEDQFARDYFGVPVDRVTEEMVTTLQGIARQIVDGSFNPQALAAVEPTKALPPGKLPDYCYFYKEDEVSGEMVKSEVNPQAAADYRARIALQAKVEAIERSQNDNRTAAEKAAAETRSREVEARKQTWFNEAVAPVEEQLNKVFAPVATDSAETRATKDKVKTIFLNGIKETLRTDPDTASIYADMVNLIGKPGKAAEIDAGNRKKALAFKARALQAQILPAASAFASASGQVLQTQINKIESAESTAPKQVVAGEIPAMPNGNDTSLYPNGMFSPKYMQDLQNWTNTYGARRAS